MARVKFAETGVAHCGACNDLVFEVRDDAKWPVICQGCDWQGLYDVLKHGDAEHRAWLRGLIQGWASARRGDLVRICDEKGPHSDEA